MEGLSFNAAAQQPKSPNSLPSSSPQSLQSSRRPSRHNSSSLSLDLSDLPPLITPSPPSNTLLITNLMDPTIFHPASLATIRQNISMTAALYSFSPLKSFRRIVATFYNTNDAITIRQQLDGEMILGNRVRVFFGAETPVDLEAKDRHLAAPAANKLFFISSKPTSRLGDAQRGAAKQGRACRRPGGGTGKAPREDGRPWGRDGGRASGKRDDQPCEPLAHGLGPRERSRSGSTTIVYHPELNGDSPLLPAVMVVHPECEDAGPQADEDDEEGKIMAHTARPPVELMDES